MNNEVIAHLMGARALIDQALSMATQEDDECDHPEEYAETLPSNGKPEQCFRCTACGETFTRPWPEE